jgi:hypothetical protein
MLEVQDNRPLVQVSDVPSLEDRDVHLSSWEETIEALRSRLAGLVDNKLKQKITESRVIAFIA